MRHFLPKCRLSTVLFISVALLSTMTGLAHPPEAQGAPQTLTQNQKPTKGPITGEYVVSDIKRPDQGGFEVFFKKVSPADQFNELKLVSANIHVGLKPGLVVRLAAEYLGTPQKSVELSQVLIYLPGNGTTYVPVWLMSSKVPQNGLTASKFLEMHAPSMDYQVY